MQLNKKEKVALGLAALAAAYSYIPSMAGKANYYSMREEREKVLYLTFDDGPNPIYTKQLLDLLKKYNIPASFFVVAEEAEKNVKLMKRMQEEGHLIGLHSLAHKSAMLQTPMYTAMDFDQSIRIMKKLGINPKFYRPPWGHVNLFTLRQVKKYNLKKVLWHVMAEDWKADTCEEEIQYKLLKRSEKGDVICLHDGRGETPDAPGKTLAALELTIPIWLENGYCFKTIDEKTEDGGVRL